MTKVWHHYARESRVREYADRKAVFGRTRFIFLDQAQAGLPEKAHDTALWGLLPPGGQAHPNLAAIRRQAAAGEKLYLLELRAAPEDDLYVADTSMFREIRNARFPDRMEWDSPEGLRLREAFKEQAKPLYRAYWQSLIPFADYTPGRYSEPEVVSFSPIPLTRARRLETSDEFVRPCPSMRLCLPTTRRAI